MRDGKIRLYLARRLFLLRAHSRKALRPGAQPSFPTAAELEEMLTR